MHYTISLLEPNRMSEQPVLSAIAQFIKFLTNEDIKPGKIFQRLQAKFRDETLS